MSAAETGFVELPDTCSTAEALRKYSGHKSWSTRYINKVSKSQPLLDKSYNRSVWCRKYEAYYHASNRQLARNQVQQAYLLNCLDSDLYLRLTSAIATTTPVLGAGASCLTMLTNIFRQKYPLLLRRKTFFGMEQQPGQDERAFLESIKASAGEADIQGMTLEDALCLVCLTALKTTGFVRSLASWKLPLFQLLQC